MAQIVSLDEDVAGRLQAEAERRGTAPDELANDVLRRALQEPFAITGPFVRSRPGYSFDKIERLLDEVEGPMRK